MFLNFSVMPLRIATLAGAAFSALGGLVAIAVVVEALFFDTPRGWASVMAAVLLLSGVQLSILGIAGDQFGIVEIVARIHAHARGKTAP